MINTNLKFWVVILLGVLLTACSDRSEIMGENQIIVPGELSDEIQTEIFSDLNTDQLFVEDENLDTDKDGGLLFFPTPSPLFEQNYGQNEVSDRDYSDLEIVTLLPPDAIPAFTFPEYYSVKEANQEYVPEEMVIGVEFNGDARAYSVSLLSKHEIVNDTVGGIHLAVTW
jgi:hypothetical protein